MADGLLLTVAGVVCLVVFVVQLVHADRAAGASTNPSASGWLLLVVGIAATGSGALLLWLAALQTV